MARAFETGRILPYLILAITGTALASALVMRIVDSDEYPTFGRAAWWAAQTVTTVGYGDVTPVSTSGRVVATVLMIMGFAFLSIITGTVASLLVAQQTGAHDLERRIEALEEEVKNRPQ